MPADIGEQELDPNAPGVIGAGFGRTGTTSLTVALDEIGQGPTMHMVRLVEGPESFFTRIKRMIAFVNAAYEKDKKKRQEYLREAMRGYKSGVDLPVFLFYEDYMEMFPNKKVILTLRDNAEEWHRSVAATILNPVRPDMKNDLGLWIFFKLTPPGFLMGKFFGSFENVLPFGTSTDLKRTYDEWNAKVMRTVPKDKLLVFNVKEGWDPLVKFLGVQKPSSPFPRVNDTKEINDRFNVMRLVGVLFMFLYVFIAYRTVKRVTRLVLGAPKPRSTKKRD